MVDKVVYSCQDVVHNKIRLEVSFLEEADICYLLDLLVFRRLKENAIEICRSFVCDCFKDTEMYDWLINQGITNYTIYFSMNESNETIGLSTFIEFIDPQDAILFKLTWV